jgi:hypothetical protein
LTAACGDAPSASGKTPAKTTSPKDDNDDKDDKDDDTSSSSSSTKTTTTESPPTADRTPATAPAVDGGADAAVAIAFPHPAGANDCKLGSGVYCGGNGVEGDLGTLYRCKDGTVDVEKKCGTSCLWFKDGVPDACDGDATKCPNGAGTYCGGNLVSGDPKTLYRCNAGAVTVEKVCETACTKVTGGKTDKCE